LNGLEGLLEIVMTECVRTGEWYTFGELGERVPDLGAATLKL